MLLGQRLPARLCCLGRPCCLPAVQHRMPAAAGAHNLVPAVLAHASLLRQAHFINNRTMEVFRQLRADGAPGRPGAALAAAAGAGASLADAVAAASPPLEQWRRFVYCESALGAVLGETDHFPARLRGPGWAAG